MIDNSSIETERVGCWIVRNDGDYAGCFSKVYPSFCEGYADGWEVHAASWEVVR